MIYNWKLHDEAVEKMRPDGDFLISVVFDEFIKQTNGGKDLSAEYLDLLFQVFGVGFEMGRNFPELYDMTALHLMLEKVRAEALKQANEAE